MFLAHREAVFRSRFWLDRGKTRRSESCTSCLNMSSFLKLWTCGSNCSESERIYARTRRPRGGSCEIFSIILFPSVFARTVDVALDVGFRRSWRCWKACVTSFIKVMDLYGFNLGGCEIQSHEQVSPKCFPCRGAIFRSRFWLDRGNSWRFESCVL